MSMWEVFDGIHIANGSFDAAEALWQIWISNKETPKGHRISMTCLNPGHRFREKAPLLEADSDTYYGGSPKGYTDYPTLHKTTDVLNA